MIIIEKKFSPEKLVFTLLAQKEDLNLRLDQFALKVFDNGSREFIKKKINLKEIRIINRPSSSRSSTKIKEGDIVSLISLKGKTEDEFFDNKKIELDLHPKIIFEDDDLLVISKPPFMSTHPTGRHIFHCATVYFEEKRGQVIHSIHRLDRETSGLLLLGKNPLTSKLLSSSFEKKKVLKAYFFISKTSNYSGPLCFKAQERLGQKELGLKRVIVHAFKKEDTKNGRTALTRFEILKVFPNYLLCLAFPYTGRQHQIRVHAQKHKIPLLGDKLYLGNYKLFARFKDKRAQKEDCDLLELPRQALHAYAIKLNYKNEEKVFFSPLSLDLCTWMKLRLKFSERDIEDLNLALQERILSFFKEASSQFQE